MTSRSLLLVFSLLIASTMTAAEKRFDRNIIKVANPQEYTFFKLDEVNFPSLTRDGISVSSLVYKGSEYYYVEVGVVNDRHEELTVPTDFVSFDKPNYTVFRTDTSAAALEIASAVGGRFVPTPPPQVPTSKTTTYNGTATTYGNQTDISGSATTTPNNSAQAGANLGNALGNAIAARSFYKAQSREMIFAHFLDTFAQGGQTIVVKPGEARVIMCTFEQVKKKKKPFDVQIRVGGEVFTRVAQIRALSCLRSRAAGRSCLSSWHPIHGDDRSILQEIISPA